MDFKRFALTYVVMMTYIKQSNQASTEMKCFDGSFVVGSSVTLSDTFIKLPCSKINDYEEDMDYSCGLMTFDATYQGVNLTVAQGACVPTSECKNFTCSAFESILGNYNISECEATCCQGNLCNKPINMPATSPPNTDACSSDPCINGGKCSVIVSPDGSQSTMCACLVGFAGERCEEKMNLTCFTGVHMTTNLNNTDVAMLPTSCSLQDSVCMLVAIEVIVVGQTVWLNKAQCELGSNCVPSVCNDLEKLHKHNMSNCKVQCCSSNLCNHVDTEVKTTSKPQTSETSFMSVFTTASTPAFTSTTTSTTKQTSSSTLSASNTFTNKTNSLIITTSSTNNQYKRLYVCPRKNPGLIRKHNLKCPTPCKSDADCSGSKRCLCNGACGKTCSLPNITCSNQPLISGKKPGTKMVCSRSNFVGSKCHFVCLKEYKRTGFPNMNCQSNGKWDKNIVTQCEPRQTDTFVCPKRNKRVVRLKKRTCSTACSTSADCSSGKHCLCDGPCGRSCSRPNITCPSRFLNKKLPGRKISCSNGVKVGSMCLFTCSPGFTRKGLPKRYCQSNGLWDKNRVATCQRKLRCRKQRPLHNRCCGKQSFNTRQSICCAKKVVLKSKGNRCCGRFSYKMNTQGCCGNKIFRKNFRKCCNRKVSYLIATQQCLGGNVIPN